MSKRKEHFRSSFKDYLVEEGIPEETSATAVKSVPAGQLEQAMEKSRLESGH